MRMRSLLSTAGLGLALLLAPLGCGGGDQGIDETIDAGDSAPIDPATGADEPSMTDPVVPIDEADPAPVDAADPDPVDEADLGDFEVAPPIDTPAPEPEPETP